MQHGRRARPHHGAKPQHAPRGLRNAPAARQIGARRQWRASTRRRWHGGASQPEVAAVAAARGPAVAGSAAVPAAAWRWLPRRGPTEAAASPLRARRLRRDGADRAGTSLSLSSDGSLATACRASGPADAYESITVQRQRATRSPSRQRRMEERARRPRLCAPEKVEVGLRMRSLCRQELEV